MECKYSTLLQHAAQIIPNLLGKGNTPLLPDINLGRTSAHDGNSRRNRCYVLSSTDRTLSDCPFSTCRALLV